jgi:quinohemoprotein amine dehydrogenase
VKYLSTAHGLAPEEARPVLHLAERRVQEEIPSADDSLHNTCARCHSLAVSLSWRRSPREWKRFADSHASERDFRSDPRAIALLGDSAQLHSSDWESWRSRITKPAIAGRWLLTATLPGRGAFYGEMVVESGADGELASRASLKSVRDGTTLSRTGRAFAYADYAWRGRSTGERAAVNPDDPSSESREVMWFSSDGSIGEGRWFWGQYQEFGFEVRLRRPSPGPTLLTTEPRALRVGAGPTQIRLIGDKLPSRVRVTDLNLGPGVTVRRIVSVSPGEVIVDAAAASDAIPGVRDVTLGETVLHAALAVYDRLDYVKVVPESAVASFSDGAHPPGYVPFEAIGYQRGPDDRLRTADDIELGPVDVAWTVQVFHDPKANADYAGKISRAGLFVPAGVSPGNSLDVWAVAVAGGETDRNGRPLTGKSYLVVAPAVYTLNGRRYIRDLARWIDDGPAAESKP